MHNDGSQGYAGIIEGTHADVCISKGSIVTLNDAYIRQGGKMMT